MHEPRPARRLDLRLATPAVAAWVSAAVLTSASPRTAGVVAAAAVLAAVTLRRRLWWAAAAVGVVAGAATVGIHLAALRSGPVAALARERASVEVLAVLVRDPVTVRARTGHRLVVADATVRAVRRPAGRWLHADAPVVVFAIDPRWRGLLPGQRVRAVVRLAPPRPGDSVAAAALATGPPRQVGRPPVWQRAAARVRAGLRGACLPLPADERGLLPGVVLGDVSLMPADLTEAFRVTGLAHLNAVSGANVAIVLAAVALASRRVGLGRRTRLVVAAACLLGFVVLVRPSPSVLRAAVMGAVVLVGVFSGRRGRAVPALSAAVLLLVLVDPFLARAPGFAMSVLATAAIVLVAPAWTARLARRMPTPIAAALAVPAAAQLACTPVIVAAFGQLTPYAVAANLLAAPAVAPATLLGIGCALVAVVSPALAGLLAWPAGLPAAWLVVVARGMARLPGAAARWPSGWRGLLLLAATAGTAWACARVGRRLRARAMLAAWR